MTETKPRPSLPLMASVAALTPLGVDLYLPAFQAIADDLTSPISIIQNSLSLFLLGFGFGLFFFGPCADRYGRRPLALLGVAGFAVASLLISLSATVEQFLSLRFLQGFLGSAATVVIPAMIRDTYGLNTAKGISSVSMIMLLAPLLAPIIGSYLLLAGHWQALFLFLTAYSLIIFILIALFLPETLPSKISTNKLPSFIENYKIILSKRSVFPDLICFMLTSLTFFTYLTSASFIYITYFEIPSLMFGYTFAATAGALICAQFINYKIVHLFGSRKIMQCGLSSAVFFAALLILVNLNELSVYWTLLLFVFLIGSIGICSSNANALILIEFPNQASSASAIIGTLRFGIGALAGPILAIIYNGTPIPINIMMFLLILSACFLQLYRNKKVT